ncbi:MAG: HAMP domain-containing histidine kinase, partial [Nitrospira sp.]|nr:HAMP domain-containing histidine kinase [Nitrospira sp.]
GLYAGGTALLFIWQGWWVTTVTPVSIWTLGYWILFYREIRAQSMEERDRRREAELVATASATLAHSLKTPLLELHEYLKELKPALGSQDVESVLELWSLLENRVKKLKSTVNQLSKSILSKPPSYEPCDLIAVLEEALEEVQQTRFGKRKIKMVKNYQTGRSFATVKGDFKYLKLVFSNLLTNACEAMEEEGTLTLTGFLTEGSTPSVCIEIADTGRGISEEDQKKLFTPFFTTKGSGTGLGLWTTQKIVEDYHHGQLSITSRLGEGTRVRVLLPKEG